MESITKEELFKMGVKTLVEQNPDRIFYRIPDLREVLSYVAIEGADFDELIKAARDSEEIQLHSGDVTSMTLEEARKRFTDENGFTFGTFTIEKLKVA